MLVSKTGFISGYSVGLNSLKKRFLDQPVGDVSIIFWSQSWPESFQVALPCSSLQANQTLSVNNTQTQLTIINVLSTTIAEIGILLFFLIYGG